MPCCVVCKNAGKADFMHETKDRNGQTRCPTLLQRRCLLSCKVCKDSGKSEATYTSHNVKDARGVVICPTLLGQECLKCNRKGHTASYCTFQTQKFNSYDDGYESDEPEPTKANIAAQRALVKAQEQKQAKAAVQPTVSFVPDTDFPSLSESLSANVTLRPHQKSWASVAQTPASVRAVPKQTAVLKKALGISGTTHAATTAAATPDRENKQWRCMWDEQRRRDAPAVPAAAVPVFVPSAQIAMALTAENLAIMRQSLKRTTCCWADFEEDD